jgi:uncharacterized delta-60 repeat protein
MTGFDLTFDSDGRVVTDLGGNDLLNQLEPLADGKILAIGQSFNGTNQGYVLIRYNSDGSLDNSFGTAGKSNTEIISLQTNVLIKPDGKIVIGGRERNGASSVYQYLPNGQIDSGFASAGRYVTSNTGSVSNLSFRVNPLNGNSEIVVEQFVVQGGFPNPLAGSIVVHTLLDSNGQVKPYPLAGITGSTPFNLELDSLNKAILSSTIDRTDPKVLNILNVFGEPFIDELRSRFGQLRYSIVAVLNRFQSDGSVLLNFQGALQGSFSSSLSILYRFSPEGKFDASYGNNGFLAPLISSFVGSDGDFDQADRIVLAGYDSTANSILVYRGTKNGQLDRSFGINGTATVPPSPNFGEVSTRRSIAVEIDSKKRAVIIIKSNDDNFITVFRLDENGILDNTFGTNGQLKLLAEVGSIARFNLVKLEADNRLLIGSETNPNGDIAFARYDIGGAGEPVTPPRVFTVTPSTTDAEILTSFLGVITGLSNIKLTTTGDRRAIGSFQNDPLSLDKGVVLSTGQVSQLVGANQTDKSNVSTDFNLPGTLPNGRDAITLEITFDADINAKQVFFQYVFGSEEFLDFAGSNFNDIFTLELNGINLAKLSDGKTASINNLTPSSTPSSFNPDYIDNLVTTNPANSQIVLDGYSKPLRFVGDLIPGAINKLVITIQDISDGALDSAVFLKGGTFGVIDPNNTTVGGGLNLIGANNLDVGATNNLTSSAFAINPSDITLTSNEINLIGGSNSITSPGKNLVLQTFDPNQNIQIGSADSGDSGVLDLTDTDLTAIANGFSKITIGRANGNGSININSSISFSDPILLQSPTGQVNINAPITLTDEATLDFNTKTLIKSGESSLTLNGNNVITFVGSTVINSGSLVLAKASNLDTLNAPIYINTGTLQLGNNEQINNSADLTLNSGTFNLNGFNETLNLLKVSSNTTIDFGNSSSTLAFADSSAQAWTGILSINNWSSTTGETLRFGNSANGLTTAQLNNIQFMGFNKGATIDATGFITPNADQDGVSDSVENLAPNNGDGNLDGIPDSKQDNVASVLTIGGTNADNITTLVSSPGTKISGLQLLPNPIALNDLTSLANPAEFKITGIGKGATTTVEFLIAKADQNRKYNTYLMSGKTSAKPTTHLYEFLYDGQTGAELFDTNNDGFTDKVILHFIDGQRGDNDLTVNGEIQDPGAPGVSNNLATLSKDANNVIQISGTTGTAVANFSLVANHTKQVSEVGFFKVDANNGVNGIAPKDSSFARTALQNGGVIFSVLADNMLTPTDISRQLQISAGDHLGFYLVKNGTVDAALQKNDFSNVVFSMDQANSGNTNYLQVNPLLNNGYQLKWLQGNNSDDLTLNLQLNNTPLNNQNLIASSQGSQESEFLDLRSFTGQNIQVNFTLKREAAYNNTVGFYKVEDAQGTIISLTGAKIKPGEASYKATVIQNRIMGLDLAVDNGKSISIEKTIQGGAIYAPFLISNGNLANINGSFSNLYTPYLIGNGDSTDHIRLLGDNIFGFEDLAGGGDQDFNDMVLKIFLIPT